MRIFDAGDSKGDRSAHSGDPQRPAADLYVPRKTKAALAVGVCLDCDRDMEVIDTWERLCPDKGCGYTFNYYHWPWITAKLPPEEGGAR